MNALIRAHLGMAEIVQFGKFDDPNSPRLHGRVFTAQVRQFVGEVLASDRPECRRFSDALRSFENQAAIGLRPRLEDSRDGRDEPTRPDGARVVRILDTQVGKQPAVEALDSIPKKTMQVGLQWVKWMVPSGSLNCLAGDVDGD
jgi:hypothetical protein